jgi:hypothetical protein
MDPATATAQAAAATAASVQTLVNALHSGNTTAATTSSHRLSLSSFWREDPVGWFHYAEAEFVVANLQLNSYLCYSHVLRALSPEVIATVRDYVRTITPETPDAYATLKSVLITRFSPSQIDNCFKVLDLPPMGDRHPLAYLSDILALLPSDGNLMINAIFLRGQTEAMKAALADKAELSPFELAQAATRLPRSAAVQPPAAVNAAPGGFSSPPVMEASAAPFAPRRPDRPISHGRRSPTSRRPPQARRRTPSPNRQRRPLPQPPPSSGLCFYHYHFGSNAHRCTPPCNWRAEN